MTEPWPLCHDRCQQIRTPRSVARMIHWKVKHGATSLDAVLGHPFCKSCKPSRDGKENLVCWTWHSIICSPQLTRVFSIERLCPWSPSTYLLLSWNWHSVGRAALDGRSDMTQHPVRRWTWMIQAKMSDWNCYDMSNMINFNNIQCGGGPERFKPKWSISTYSSRLSHQSLYTSKWRGTRDCRYGCRPRSSQAPYVTQPGLFESEVCKMNTVVNRTTEHYYRRTFIALNLSNALYSGKYSSCASWIYDLNSVV